MTPEQLKASILQRAMEGKLVPQDPNDEPASELLKRIKAEKEKLIKEGKIKRDKNETEIFRGDDGLHYEKFQDGSVKQIEVPYEIPESWEWIRLENITKIINDGVHSTPKYVNSGIPFLSVKDMSSGQLSFRNTKFISEEEHLKLSKRCKPEKNDIILSKVGTTGIPVKVDVEKEFSIFVSLALLKFIHPFNPDFLVELIKSPLVYNQSKDGTRGVGNKNLVLSVIKKFLIPLPPVNEQTRILNRINKINKFVVLFEKFYSSNKKIKEEFPEKLRQSILQYAMQGKLVPQDATDEPVEVLLERIREEKQRLFEEGKLKKKDLQESIIYQSDDNSYYGMTDLKEERENWLFLRVKDIFRTIPIKKYQIKQSEILKEGLYPVVSQSKKLVEGYSNSNDKLYQHSKPIIVFGDHTRIVKLVNFDFVVGADGVKLMEPIYINSEFGYLCLKFCCIDLRNRGYSRHYSHLQKMYIGIPNKTMQLRIVGKITILDRYVNLLENKINKHI